jgi:hypothetical protein
MELVSLDVQTPAQAGRYRLDVTIPSLDLTLVRTQHVQLVSDRLPDSRHDAASLAAVYDPGKPSEPLTTVASDRLMFTLSARNTGAAIWLSEGRTERGTVRLGWRWSANGIEVPQLSGRLPLAHDVYPGQEHRFRAAIKTPATPGLYLLELSLVSENVAWFFDLGTPALRVPVSVARAGPPAVEILQRTVSADAAAVLSRGPASRAGVHLTLSDSRVAHTARCCAPAFASRHPRARGLSSSSSAACCRTG